MKIKVSKKFADFINKTANELNFRVSAKVVELSPNSYKYNVDFDLFRAYDYGDFNATNGTYKAIILVYPAGFCATPKYLSTYELNKEYHRTKVQDIEGLKGMIKNLCAI